MGTLGGWIKSRFMKLSFQSKMKWGGVICFIGLFAFIIYRYNSQLWILAVRLWDIFKDHHRLKEFIFSFGIYSPLAFILLQVIQVVVAPIPGGAIEFLGGYLFGVWAGMFYSMIGLILGSWLAFALARIFEKWVVEKFVSPKTMKKFDYLIGHEGVILSFLLFLIPGFPKDALCYILGLTPMHLGIFLVISTIGRIPGTLMATLQGAKAFEHQYILFLILLGVSGLVILVFYIYHEEIHQLIKKLK
jgi:uncharacterized membrane protein YdjX (TVP38/TMEM64 family)